MSFFFLSKEMSSWTLAEDGVLIVYGMMLLFLEVKSCWQSQTCNLLLVLSVDPPLSLGTPPSRYKKNHLLLTVFTFESGDTRLPRSE